MSLPLERGLPQGRRLLLLPALFTSAALATYYCPDFIWPMVNAAFQTSQNVIDQGIQTMVKIISKQEERNFQEIMAALKVLTKQKNISSEKLAAVNKAGDEALATVMVETDRSRRIQKAYFDFHPKFGQGFEPCNTYAASRKLTAAADALSEEAAKAVGQLDAGPGKYFNPIWTRNLSVTNNLRYCDKQLSSNGLCSDTTELLGEDSIGASVHFGSLLDGDKPNRQRAQQVFLNNMFGQPDPPPPTLPANSPPHSLHEMDAYLAIKLRKDALLAPAMQTMQEIRLAHSPREGDEPGLVKQMDQLAGVYFGGDKHQDWNKTLARQTERGLMVELLKVKGFDLMVQGQQYRQWERMEAMLANLVASEIANSPLSARVEANRRASVDSQIRNRSGAP